MATARTNKKRLAGPTQPGTGNATSYTAPASGAVIRQIHVFNTDTVQRWVSIALNGTGATVANCFAYQMLIQPKGSYDWTGEITLGNADTIQTLQETATACTLIVSGEEL